MRPPPKVRRACHEIRPRSSGTNLPRMNSSTAPASATIPAWTPWTVWVIHPATTMPLVMTVGFLVLMLWMLLVSVVVILKGGLPSALGWFGVVVLLSAVIVVLFTSRDRELMMGDKIPSRALSVVYGAVLVGLTVWIVWLGAAPVSSI